MSDDERRYSREEVALVLRNVAQRSVALGDRDGLTKAELQEVVREVGLDVAQVDGALAELENQDKKEARLLGMRQYVVVQRSVEGKLDVTALQRASKLINRSVGTIGKSEVDDQGLSWFGRAVNVSISQAGERVAVQIEERFHNTTRMQLTMGLMFSMMFGMMTLVGLANVGLEALGFALGASVVGAAYAAIRRLHTARVAATQKRLEGLGDQLVEMLKGGAEIKALPEGDGKHYPSG